METPPFRMSLLYCITYAEVNNAANHSAVPQDLSKFDYVEEEYFVSGIANVYDFDGDSKIMVKAADAPYTTRILVRRPASPHEYFGRVESWRSS